MANSGLLLGVSHSGKTRSFGTMPGRVILFNLEPPDNVVSLRVPYEETESLVDWWKDQPDRTWEKVLVVQYNEALTNVDLSVDFRPSTKSGNLLYTTLIKDINEAKRHSELFDSIGFDSLYPMTQMCLDFILAGNQRTRTEWNDFRDSARKMLEVMSYVLALRKNVVVVTHIQQETDEATGRIRPLPSSIGKIVPNQFPKLFGECFKCVIKPNTKGGVDYLWQTHPDDEYDYLGSRKRDNLPKLITQNWEVLWADNPGQIITPARKTN